ncbi:hypothetical protein [Enterococcus sp. AZ192]|uniref:hypothetical protein n=1 Tax=unclassified Enterococcus TaxID=2608891 RepID=UPI003D2C2DCA
MNNKKIIGEWIDKMNDYQNKKVNLDIRVRIAEKIEAMFNPIKILIRNNWFIFTISTLIAIPCFITSFYILNSVIVNITNLGEIKSILAISGVLLVIPLFCLYVYFVYKLSIKKRPAFTVVLILGIIGLFMLNVIGGIDLIKTIEAKKEAPSDLFLKTFLIDTYTISFMITKLTCLLFNKIIDKIKKVGNWIVDDAQDNNDILKAKLSFINKIITGFIAIVASILGLLLTLNKIF